MARGVIQSKHLRGAECKVGVPLSSGGKVSEGFDSVKERYQVKDDLKEEGVDTEHYLNNGLRDNTFASDYAPKKQGLNSLCLCPIYL